MNTATYKTLFSRVINTGSPDASKTLKGFQKRAAVTREAVKLAHEQYQRDLDELAQTYTKKAFDERREPLDHEYNEIVKLAKQRCTDDLEAVLKAKRDQFDRSNGAPSDEQTRLLTVLNMRTDLTESEVTAVANKLNNNVPALRLLRDIARRNGVPFPDVGSANIFDEDISAAERYAREMIESVGVTDDKSLNYRQLCFWKYADHTTEADHHFRALDNNILTAAQQTDKQAREDPSIPTGKRPNAVKFYLRGDENLAGISLQFGIDSAEIRAANPGKDMSQLHYGDTLIVPAGTMKVTNQPGSVVPDQCTPIYFELSAPAPKTGDYINLAD